MSRATVELDFFAMGRDNNNNNNNNSNNNNSSSCKSRFLRFNRQRSFRDIQSAISKINPDLLKSVIASGSVNQRPSSDNGSQFESKKIVSVVPSTPKEEAAGGRVPPLPVYSPLQRPVVETSPGIAPLTIFYNGTVAVFDVPRDKAESILKLAERGISKSAESSSTNQPQLLDNLDGDLPIARRKSLQRFLEKRKERLTVSYPYGCPTNSRI